jgi:hypothetical protein
VSSCWTRAIAFIHRSLPVYFSPYGRTPNSSSTSETQLDRLYQKIVDDLDTLLVLWALKLPEPLKQREQSLRYASHNGLRFFADCAAKKWPLSGQQKQRLTP